MGIKTLRQLLAFYFIPISILPTLLVSYYCVRLFEDNIRDTVSRRAVSEQQALSSEMEFLESDLLSSVKNHSRSSRLMQLLKGRQNNQLEDLLEGFPSHVQARIFSPSGQVLANRNSSNIPYIAKSGLSQVKEKGFSIERYFAEDGKSLVWVARSLIQDKFTLFGVLEEQVVWDQKMLSELKSRKQVDLAFLTLDLRNGFGSFAIESETFKKFTQKAFRPETLLKKNATDLQLGDVRFSGFLYPVISGSKKPWCYMAVFIPMAQFDAVIEKLKWALLYVAMGAVLVASFLILIISNRIVKPIEVLIQAMKRVKTGRVEQIPPIDSTYEIEYLVHSFNEMSRNVSGAKRVLELKLDELKTANEEIKDTQTTLVQSAKMISLGQIVAGVAHELNNPIGFIYSNLYHLSDYLTRLKKLITEYENHKKDLDPKEIQKLEALEKEIELPFILKDMGDLIQSCVDGAKRTKDIVLGLRNFSRMEESSFAESDIREGIRSTLKLLNSELKDRITVHEELGEIPPIMCSLTNLNQVFMNLLSNAIQAIPGKGDIWIKTWKTDSSVCISIEDNGSGISKENQEKVFDPFFTTKKVGEGTGLGLSIVYGIIQKHNGSIVFESEEGRGTKFTIELPL